MKIVDNSILKPDGAFLFSEAGGKDQDTHTVTDYKLIRSLYI